MSGSSPVIVLTTLGTSADAAAFAERLVEERLAACVNVLPEMDSTYRWDGQVQRDRERQVVIKTTTGRLDELKRRIAELHSYEVPELRRAVDYRWERRLSQLGGEHDRKELIGGRGSVRLLACGSFAWKKFASGPAICDPRNFVSCAAITPAATFSHYRRHAPPRRLSAKLTPPADSALLLLGSRHSNANTILADWPLNLRSCEGRRIQGRKRLFPRDRPAGERQSSPRRYSRWSYEARLVRSHAMMPGSSDRKITTATTRWMFFSMFGTVRPRK